MAYRVVYHQHASDSSNVIVAGGWLPPDDIAVSELRRTPEQNELAELFDSEVQDFGSVGTFLSNDELPERALLFELELKTNGKLMPRPHQMTGSCVGSGAVRAYCQTICGDVAHRGDHEEIKLPCFLPTYGRGRQLGGFKRKGSGSFGGAQSKSVSTFGMVPFDHPSVPKPRFRSDGWFNYTSQQEYQWSHPSSWPVQYNDLLEDADDHLIETIARVRNVEQLQQLIAQGYGVTLASMFGTRPRVRSGLLVGEWNASWAHQMSCSGYWVHPELGLLFLIDNQWGPNGHNINCPYLAEFGVKGSFWIRSATMARIINNGEVIGHSNTMGFPKREPYKYSNLGFPTDINTNLAT